jgi:glycosyltransferase involved in cell wall biosynthesis
MHILISGTFWSQPTVGSGQYLTHLVRGLREVAPQHRYTLVVPAYAGNPPPLPNDIGGVGVRTPFDGRSNNLAKLWFEQIAVPMVARRLGADLIHIPYAAPPLHSSVPVVTTVHDIIWRVLPAYAGKAHVRTYYRLVSAAIRKATHVITDSEHSRNDIITILETLPERVSTVPLAVGEQYRPLDPIAAQQEVWQRYGIATPFVYYVGGYDVRKNVGTLVRAFGRLRNTGTAATLVLAGQALSGDRQLFPDIDGLIAEYRLTNSVRRVSVPPEDGPLLFAAATVAVYPSIYEGFGLPPLEAMACGTPVIVSDASSLPEVVGDAAICLPPDNPTAWADALRRVLEDASLRERLQKHGLERAATFSWQRMIRETVAIYEQVGRQENKDY